MGCCSSSEASAERSAARGDGTSGPRKELSGKGGQLREVSVTGDLELNCERGHPLDRYDVLDTLGTGGFAVVKHVRDKHTSENYAMKIISVKVDVRDKKRGSTSGGKGGRGKGHDDEEDKEQMSVKEVMSEIETLRNLRHGAILDLKEYYVQSEEKHVYVITEILYGGAVLDAILKMKDERYTEAEAKVVVRRTLEGIDYMHQKLVVHRDLKLENLLLRRDDDLNSVVIADFGLAKRCREKAGGSAALPHAKGVDDSAVGTPVYAAPEVVDQKSYGAAVDMWSLGVITYILVTGAMPRDLWKSALKYGRVTESDFGFDCYEWDTVSVKAREFVQACLAYKPSNRLSASAALNHKWMKHVPNVRPAPLRIKNKLRDFAKGMKLPTRRYQPGEFLIKQGARATDEVFLIKSGKVDIIVKDKETGENVKVATRESGEFVGEMSVGASILTRSDSAKGGSVSSTASSPTAGARGKEPGVEAPASPAPTTAGKTQAAGVEGEGSSSGGGGGGGIGSFSAALAAKIASKKWVGQRRTADVVAATKVECLVLGKREMQWAITHDESIRAELQKDIKNRRVQTDASLQLRKSASMGRNSVGDAVNEGDVDVRV